MSLSLNLLFCVLYGVTGEYIGSSIEMTYYDALIYCEREYNTGLVSITDNNVNNDVLNLCNNNSTCWIGNNDESSINSYNNWNHKRVNKVGLSECPAMIAGTNGEWANVKCNNKYIAICDTRELSFGFWLIKSVNKSRRLGFGVETYAPTAEPTAIPTTNPTMTGPTYNPTVSPTNSTLTPTGKPFTDSPTHSTLTPTNSPTNSTVTLTGSPSLQSQYELKPYLSCCDDITDITVPMISNNISIWEYQEVNQLTFYVYVNAWITLDTTSILIEPSNWIDIHMQELQYLYFDKKVYCITVTYVELYYYWGSVLLFCDESL